MLEISVADVNPLNTDNNVHTSSHVLDQTLDLTLLAPIISRAMPLLNFGLRDVPDVLTDQEYPYMLSWIDRARDGNDCTLLQNTLLHARTR